MNAITTDAGQRLIEDLRKRAQDADSTAFERLLDDAADEIERLRGVEARWQCVVDGARRGNFGEWVIFPDDPHDRHDTKVQFVRDVDAAIAASRSTGAADVGEDHG